MSPWQPGMILVFFFYFFIRPSISVCISLAFRNLPKHHWKSSWEGNRLLWRVSHLILLLFIWMHVICCHSNHSLFSLECTQKSHLNSKTNAVTKKVGHVQKCSHRLSHVCVGATCINLCLLTAHGQSAL